MKKCSRCSEIAVALGLCKKHYQRKRRLGTIDLSKHIEHGSIEKCLVFGCEEPYRRNGYCNTHALYNRRHGTPYAPKVIKLCGVMGCEEPHKGKGLCQKHFNQWRNTLKEHSIQ